MKVKAKKPENTPEPKKEEVETDNCPSCEKLIAITSSKCEHCGEEFDSYETEQPSANLPY